MVKKDIVVVGNMIDLLPFERPIDYGDMQPTYDLLRPEFKKLVDETVRTLTENEENVGYNLRQVQDWFERSGVKRYQIAKVLVEMNLYDIFGDDRGGEIDTEENGDVVITKLISKYQNTVAPKGGTTIRKIIDLLCDYYLIDKTLIYRGDGEVYWLADPYFDEYREDKEFHAWADNHIDPDKDTTLERTKKYAEYKNVKFSDILEESYAMIEYSGSYQILTGRKYETMKIAVDNLMKGLLRSQGQ